MNSLLSHVRTRFAPSPTGRVHIGNVRTILYAWLTARHANGVFVLRIEDTDQKRLVEGSLDELYKMFEWLGLGYDEGPGKPGVVEEYVQSKRKDLHVKSAFGLLEKGAAYKCYCTAERLDEMRKEQESNKRPPKYDRRCLHLTPEEIKAHEDRRDPYVIRLKVPDSGITEFTDLIRGKIRFNNADIDDQVLLKSDGYPTYHLANVVDDHDMQITHVVRADEWLPSTPKHVLLYDAFGWELPVFAHVTLVVNAQGKKLSKRDGDTAFWDYVDKGYLRDALLNFLVLQGWNPKTTQEVFTLEEMIKLFDISKVHKAAPVFNVEKLDWFNQYYIRKLTPDQMLDKCRPYLEKKFDLSKVDTEKLKKIVMVEQARIKKLSDIPEMVDFFFALPDYDPKMLVWKKATVEETKKALEKGIEVMESIPDGEFNKENIEKLLRTAGEASQIPTGTLFWPIRVALTGKDRSPSPVEVAEILGATESIRRIKCAFEKITAL